MRTRFDTGEIPVVSQEVLRVPSCKVADLFTGDLRLNTLPQVGNAFSQTPGDPFRLSAGSVDYYRGAQELMHGRLYSQAIKVGILPAFPDDKMPSEYFSAPEHHHTLIDFMQREIDLQHDRRCEASELATGRLGTYLLENQTDEVDAETADLIWRYRTGQIRPSEVAVLLAQFPVMKSAEAAKRTMPFEDEAMGTLDDYMMREFLLVRARLIERGIDARIDFSSSEEQPMLSIRQYSEDGSMCMIVGKQTIGEIEAEGYPTIQLKRKKAMVGISPELKIDGLTPDIKLIDKMPYNLQLVGGSYYFCIKKEAEELSDDGSNSRDVLDI